MNDARKTQWELQQLATAINYFEQALIDAHSDQDILDHKETLENLNRQYEEMVKKQEQELPTVQS